MPCTYLVFETVPLYLSYTLHISRVGNQSDK